MPACFGCLDCGVVRRCVLRAGLRRSAPAAAQDWPTRTVRIIIPLGARRRRRRVLAAARRGVAEALRPAVRGGEPARRRAQHRHARLRGGARPTATRICVLSGEPVVYNQFTFKNLPFNPEKDFEPITNLFINSNALVVELQAQRQDHSRTGRARQGQARHAELRHVLVRAGVLHGQAEQEARHRHRAGAVPQRQRDGQRDHVRLDADRVSRPRQHARRRSRAVRSPASRSTPTRARRCFPIFRRCWRRPARTIRRPGSGCSRRPARRSRSSKRSTPRSLRITSGLVRQKNFIDRAVEPAVGPREEFVKFIADNRAFAARIAKDTGIQPQ